MYLPFIRSVSILMRIHRTKIAMKMSRVSDKNKELLAEKAESSESDISEDDEDDEDDEETPDTEADDSLYRNSSLRL